MVRQKKPRKLFDNSSALALTAVDPSVVEQYLRKISFTGISKYNKHRQVYQFLRKLMFDSLTDKQKSDSLFAALIERIARMTVILDKVERQLFDDLPNMDQEKIIERLGGHYLSYLKEYRNFISAFSDLRFAGEEIQKTTSIEKIREITREQVDGST